MVITNVTEYINKVKGNMLIEGTVCGHLMAIANRY